MKADSCRFPSGYRALSTCIVLHRLNTFPVGARAAPSLLVFKRITNLKNGRVLNQHPAVRVVDNQNIIADWNQIVCDLQWTQAVYVRFRMQPNGVFSEGEIGNDVSLFT